MAEKACNETQRLHQETIADHTKIQRIINMPKNIISDKCYLKHPNLHKEVEENEYAINTDKNILKTSLISNLSKHSAEKHVKENVYGRGNTFTKSG